MQVSLRLGRARWAQRLGGQADPLKDRKQQDKRRLSEVVGILSILRVVVVSQMCACVETHHIVHFTRTQCGPRKAREIGSCMGRGGSQARLPHDQGGESACLPAGAVSTHTSLPHRRLPSLPGQHTGHFVFSSLTVITLLPKKFCELLSIHCRWIQFVKGQIHCVSCGWLT